MRILAALLLLPISVAMGDQPFVHQKKIKQLAEPYLEADVVRGLSIGVIRGEQTWIGHFGKLAADQPQPPDDQTIYEIGSISKVFTGVLLAHAIESGQLKLDQPIADVMTELKETNREVGQSITLLHLATHNSGLPRMPANWSPADQNAPYADYDRKLLTQFMSKVKPNKKPNEATAYSNVGAGLLGDLLSIQSAASYNQLLKRKIAAPLGMKDTTVKLSPQRRSRVAPPHNEGQESEVLWEFDALTGAGGIRSTMADMIKFMRANVNPPDGDLGKAIDLAWKQHVPSRNGQFAMGLGWHIARDGSTRWHNGQTGGYHSMMLVSRPLGAGVVVLSNTATREVDALAESIIQMMAGMDVKPKEFTKAKKVDPELMKRLVGKYKLFPNFILDVRLSGDRLMVQATGQPALPVYPESETSWKYRAVEASLTFELPAEGSASALTLHQNGRDMRGGRIKD